MRLAILICTLLLQAACTTLVPLPFDPDCRVASAAEDSPPAAEVAAIAMHLRVSFRLDLERISGATVRAAPGLAHSYAANPQIMSLKLLDRCGIGLRTLYMTDPRVVRYYSRSNLAVAPPFQEPVPNDSIRPEVPSAQMPRTAELDWGEMLFVRDSVNVEIVVPVVPTMQYLALYEKSGKLLGRIPVGSNIASSCRAELLDRESCLRWMNHW